MRGQKGFTQHQFKLMQVIKRVKVVATDKTGAGFTLIELLVVISVIGLLASVIMVSLNSARAKARDSRRKAELTQITRALELYYDTYGGYPTSAWSNANASVSYAVFSSLCNQTNFTQFMPDCPNDPKYPNVNCYNAEYVYISESFRNPGTLGKEYVLYATLEDQSTTNLNSSQWPDNNMISVWPCAGYGTPNYRIGDLAI
ncbi:MAG: hypothetical protein A3C85_04310 [Candidatus Doudnabacteria bacterium RIFCSPHIGHO2_02_FULL_48_21]|nr:MAG: hypothetical protein A3K05_00995 [Candidatus Doudnabacteria bacterium RIFCSPHIGHO2_01_48_18]OGE78884.1 MAG: hypothetical protein A2668_00710 [Candidatus Doudnabacteria bacterium RIFCSPHIGHO2_01_FULL_48_180]OGE91875.1 MAG: hypothetical protein A3F44_04390 [Candidatus Doudnabacteria bacterium RIFCSPHIGHO2_12_FULL_47_25]OGE94112.1 MAG: hypothetical protein A3C85_04310 [Candidatus Doudnabacteria bacterium RIFCSPHIGHO2_02_FULL_48_21]OGE98182.1 MAG: hypothetical protein A3A83_03365 [Candidatu